MKATCLHCQQELDINRLKMTAKENLVCDDCVFSQNLCGCCLDREAETVDRHGDVCFQCLESSADAKYEEIRECD